MKIIILSFLFLLGILFHLLINQGFTDTATKKELKNLNNKSIMKPAYIGKGYDHKQQSDGDTLSLEELIKASDIIVVGEVVSVELSVQMGRGEEATPRFTNGVIDISRVLKGDRTMKSVLLAMPSSVTIGKGWSQWEGPIYQKKMYGVWFLTKSPYKVPDNIVKTVQNKGNYYFANRDGRYRELDENLIEKISSILKMQNPAVLGATH